METKNNVEKGKEIDDELSNILMKLVSNVNKFQNKNDFEGVDYSINKAHELISWHLFDDVKKQAQQELLGELDIQNWRIINWKRIQEIQKEIWGGLKCER